MSDRNKLLAGLTAAVIVASGQSWQPLYGKSTPWDAHMQGGRAALRSGNYAEARVQLEAALADTSKFQTNDPRLGDTYYCLGQLNLGQQNYGEAKQYFERAQKVQRSIPGLDELVLADTMMGLANASEMTGDRQMAVILLKGVRDIWSRKYGADSAQLLKVLKPLGIYATVDTDFKTAQDCYTQLVRLEEQHYGASSTQAGSALNLLALTLARTGKYAESQALAERAVRILGASAHNRTAYEQAADNLAFINRQLGKPAPVLEDIPSAPATAYVPPPPPPPPAYVPPPPPPQVAVKPPVASVGQGASAGSTIETHTSVQGKIVTAPPTTPSVPVHVTPPPPPPQQIAMKPPTATPTARVDNYHPWEIAGVSSPAASNESHSNWGKIRYLSGGRLVSQEEYQAMLLANEAYELIRQEKYKMACDILRKAIIACPDVPSAHTNLGLALSQLGDNSEAITQLCQAIAIDPNKSAPWVNLANAYQVDGQLKAAVATYSEFAKRFPSHALSRKAADIASVLKKELDAQTSVEQALASQPGSRGDDYLAYASHSGEIRWPAKQTKINVYIAPADSVPGFKPEYDGFCKDSFKQWSDASGGKIAFDFVQSPSNADITWNWSNDSSKVFSPEGGETDLQSNAKEIKHANVLVLTANVSDSPLSPNQVRAVCLHEIGHALGLSGHSPKNTDIMYCSMPPAMAKPSLSPRDVGTIQRLYAHDVTIGWFDWIKQTIASCWPIKSESQG